MSFSNQTIDLEALIYALNPNIEPLPTDLQHSLAEISQFLHEDRPDTARQLRVLIRQDSLLETAYEKALDHSHDRSALFTSPENSPIVLHCKPASITAYCPSGSIPTQNFSEQRSRLLERGDRVVTLASGGAFLGVLIAQIPGAIVGGLLGGIYAWFSTPMFKTDGKN